MGRLYSCKSTKLEGATVYFRSADAAGWKLDVQMADGRWEGLPGDAWEQTIDEMLPYMLHYVTADCQWQDDETKQPVSFWEIITNDFEEA